MKRSSNSFRSPNVLERKAMNILGAVGLLHQKTRKRRIKDVDMIFRSRDFPFGDWNVRFKVCDELNLDDVATEVGIAEGNGNRIALVATTGKIHSEARSYAAYVSRKTRFQAIVLGGRELARMERKPEFVREALVAQADLARFLPAAKRFRQHV